MCPDGWAAKWFLEEKKLVDTFVVRMRDIVPIPQLLTLKFALMWVLTAAFYNNGKPLTNWAFKVSVTDDFIEKKGKKSVARHGGSNLCWSDAQVGSLREAEGKWCRQTMTCALGKRSSNISRPTCRSQRVSLTCSTALVCVLGKLVGLLSHRIKSLRDRHVLRSSGLSLPPWECPVSSRASPPRPNRRWWWSRYAALRDRKRANHLWRKRKMVNYSKKGRKVLEIRC